jgi:putative ABC transport system ATP-binding protein
MIGGADIASFEMYRLRSEILVLDRPTLVETTIRAYLALADDRGGATSQECLDRLGLSERILQLPLGLDTPLSSSGWPLSTREIMALKLAAAVARPPKLLVLSTLYDLLSPEHVAAALATLRQAGTTVLHFTRRPEAQAYDGYLWLCRRDQVRFADPAGLLARANEKETSRAVAA